MDILPEPLSFQWDKGNVPKNLHKHDVTSQEAEEIFSNNPLVVRNDAAHSKPGNLRYYALGRTKSDRKLFAVFTVVKAQLRVISIRDMTQAEEDAYEDFEEDS